MICYALFSQTVCTLCLKSYLNAPCGARAAAPYFGDLARVAVAGGLEGASCGWRLCCQRFACLGVVFLQVSACSGSLLRQELREDYARSAAENLGKVCQISSTFHQNSIQNQPKWKPGALQKRSWKQVGFRTAS